MSFEALLSGSTGLEPYHLEPGVAIYCARVEAVLPFIDPREVDLLSADPPYGVNEATERKSRGRGLARGGAAREVRPGSGRLKIRDYPRCEGDDKRFDPSPLLVFRRVALFGANHYADRLPVSPSWILWDKRDGVAADDNADNELAWTNLGGPLRIFRHLWRGTCRASETGVPHVHPMQKPVALYSWLFQWKTKPGDAILVPYAGSGPDVAAAKALGRRVVAIEISETYCAEIVKRLRQDVLPFATATANQTQVEQLNLLGAAQ